MFIIVLQNTQKTHTKLCTLEIIQFPKSLEKLSVESSSVNRLVSPLSRGEDGVGVAVSFPLLLSLLLAVRGKRLLQLLLALEQVSPRPQNVLLDFPVTLHVRQHFVQASFSLYGGAAGRSYRRKKRVKLVTFSNYFVLFFVFAMDFFISPGVLRLLRNEFFGVLCICSSSKSNSVGVGGLKKIKTFN